jgi:hypothetical protein
MAETGHNPSAVICTNLHQIPVKNEKPTSSPAARTFQSAAMSDLQARIPAIPDARITSNVAQDSDVDLKVRASACLRVPAFTHPVTVPIYYWVKGALFETDHSVN